MRQLDCRRWLWRRRLVMEELIHGKIGGQPVITSRRTPGHHFADVNCRLTRALPSGGFYGWWPRGVSPNSAGGRCGRVCLVTAAEEVGGSPGHGPGPRAQSGVASLRTAEVRPPHECPLTGLQLPRWSWRSRCARILSGASQLDLGVRWTRVHHPSRSQIP